MLRGEENELFRLRNTEHFKKSKGYIYVDYFFSRRASDHIKAEYSARCHKYVTKDLHIRHNSFYFSVYDPF
jgi:hypothetical protein